jgi:hypothetical protein
MTITITPTQILKVLHVVSWIIFIGLCVNAGGFLFNSLFALYNNPMAANNFWQGIDLSSLYDFDKGFFLIITLYMFIVGTLKAVLFYLIVKLIHDKNLNLNQPFNNKIDILFFAIYSPNTKHDIRCFLMSLLRFCFYPH